MTITDLVREAHANAVAKGWHEERRGVPEMLCLIHSEVSEALEAFRDLTHGPCETWHRDDGKPEGVPSELADVVIRIADMCGALGIDLEAAIAEKHAFNQTRSHRHGGRRA